MVVDPQETDENEEVTLSGGLPARCSFDNLVKINWGDGSIETVQAHRFEIEHTYPDDDPSGTNEDYYVIKTIDPTTERELDSTLVLVRNSDPKVTLAHNVTDQTGLATMNAVIEDKSPADTFTVDVAWGDSTTETFEYPAGTTDVSWQHQYTDDSVQTFTVEVTIKDDDGGSGSDTAIIVNVLYIIPDPDEWLPDGEAESAAAEPANSPEPEASAAEDEFPINSTTENDQFLAEVAANPEGRFVVVWDSVDQDGDGHGIVARCYSASNDPLGGEIQVNSTTAGDQIFPHVAVAADGSFVVVWEGDDADGRGLFGRRFDAWGLPQDVEFPVNTTTANDQLRPRVAADAAGGFVVVWESLSQDGDGSGVVRASSPPMGRRSATNSS